MKKSLLAAALLLGLAAYLNTLANDFVWDDEALILENANVQNPAGFPEFFKGSIASGTRRESPYFRPLYLASFWLDYQCWGRRPWGFHLTNLLLHLANIGLVFGLAFRLSSRPRTAFWASACFGVHPVLTEAVTLISGRGWLIAGVFLLSSLHLFIFYRQKRRNLLLILSLFLFLTALLTMEIAMIFPLLLLVYDFFYPVSEPKKKFLKTFLPHLAFWGLLALFIWVRLAVAGSRWFDYGMLHWDRRILTAPLIFLNYLALFVFPLKLRLERTIPFFRHPAEPAALFSWFAVLLIAAAILFLIFRRRARLFVFGFLWVIIFLIPALNLFPLRAMLAEAWLYLPAVGYGLILGAGMENLEARFPRWAVCFAALLIIFFLVRTGLRNLDWRNALVLYETSVRDSPDSVKMQYNLAATYSRLGRLEESRRAFQKISDERTRYMRDYNRNFYSD